MKCFAAHKTFFGIHLNLSSLEEETYLSFVGAMYEVHCLLSSFTLRQVLI